MFERGAFVVALLALFLGLATTWLAVGAFLCRRALARTCAGRHDSPTGAPVVLLRPCAGEEETLERCLGSIVEAKRSFPLEVVIGVSRSNDEALPAARRAAARIREAGVPCRVDVFSPIGPNRKASTMAGIARSTSAPILLGVDSNVDLAGFDLDQLVGRLESEATIGVVWSPHAEHAVAEGLGPRASVAVLDGSMMGFPVLVGIHPTGLNGKLWVARRSTIDLIGGFEGLVEHLGEDIEMARRILSAQLRVVPVSATCRALRGPVEFRDVVLRISRWMTVVRAQAPHLLPAYPLLFAPLPLVSALAALGATQHVGLSLAGVASAFVGRMIVALTGQRWSNRAPGLVKALVDCVLGDLVIVTAFLRALLKRDVVWRGNRYRLGQHGRVILVDEKLP